MSTRPARDVKAGRADDSASRFITVPTGCRFSELLLGPNASSINALEAETATEISLRPPLGRGADTRPVRITGSRAAVDKAAGRIQEVVEQYHASRAERPHDPKAHDSAVQAQEQKAARTGDWDWRGNNSQRGDWDWRAPLATSARVKPPHLLPPSPQTPKPPPPVPPLGPKPPAQSFPATSSEPKPPTRPPPTIVGPSAPGNLINSRLELPNESLIRGLGV